MTATVKAKNLTIASIVLGALGFLMFIYCKLHDSKGKGKNYPINMASKVLVALGVFLLAGAVYELSDKSEPFCASYCSTAHDPESDPWSYKTFCGPPPS